MIVIFVFFMLSRTQSKPVSVVDATSIPNSWIVIENPVTELVFLEKVPYPLENCNGSAPITTNQERSRTTTTAIELTVSGNVETDVMLAVQARIETTFNISEGETKSVKQNIQMSVGPGNRVTYELTWNESWLTGNVIINELDLTLPYRVRTGLQLIVESGAPERCPTSIVAAQDTTVPLPTPTITTEPVAGETSTDTWTPVVRNYLDVPVVSVPAGCFMMGSQEGPEVERPVHEVCVDAFWLSQTEITNKQYRACVEAGQCSPPHDSEFYDTPAYADHPVVNIDWYQANAYALWIGGSLPSEAQWEYAARGRANRIYPWGNTFDATKLNFCDVQCKSDNRDPTYSDGYATTAPVGTFPGGASWVGALDMAGNVWEWVADWQGAYPASQQTNPIGPPGGDYRIFRGGAWGHRADSMRTSFRGWYAPDLYNIDLGFRIALRTLPG
jgi:formylglycine-generating enzyme required for sulfatase activity